MTSALADFAVRQQVLDPSGSFFLRAPAGSGKTALLVQRILTLLAQVAQPEEILAITFTRKAAGEMLERVLAALAAADADLPPESPYARATWQLARTVLARDAAQGWNLRQQPGRLRIQTLDAFCATLARRHPLTASLGALCETTETAAPLYHQAALRTLRNGPRGAWETLLPQLDNRVAPILDLLADLLQRREQWLAFVFGLDHDARATTQAALRELVSARLRGARHALGMLAPEQLAKVLPEVTRNLEGSDSPILALHGCTGLPPATPEALPQWRGLGELLLTTANEPRARYTRAQGVPPAADAKGEERERRARLKAELEAMGAALDENAVAALRLARSLPDADFSDATWRRVEATVALLKHAAAELRLVFAERAQIDFTETALAAVQALGSPEAPTDLLLALDYRIRHILVDEFQDTSQLQIDLLERLTAGWSDGAGRSLFLVGDGMQSIYRFRNAKVELFRAVMEEGIAGLPLHQLALSANFRSTPGLVGWVNSLFGTVGSPATAGYFVPAVAHAEGGAQGPQWHRLGDRDAEAERVLELVCAARQDQPDGHIAILVRARSHLAAIVPALKRAGLNFQAVEVDHLGDLPVVLDLLMLTRAVLRPADRLAWLAVLRTPWVGLTLADVTRLAEVLPAAHCSVAELDATSAALPSAAQARLARLVAVLKPALAQRGRLPLRALVEGLWLALSGPALLDAEQWQAAERFFEALAKHELAGDVPEWAEFEQEVRALFAPPRAPDSGRLSIMTIHKAKGLEFDTVIFPGLDRQAPAVRTPLLRWRVEPGAGLLLAPIPPRGAEQDAISVLLNELEHADEDAETLRLIYVALTRARHALHLCCVLPEAEAEEEPAGVPSPQRLSGGRARTLKPLRGSLLHRLWGAVSAEVLALPTTAHTPAVPSPQSSPTPGPGRRLSVASPSPQWPQPLPPTTVPPAVARPLAPPFDWAQEEARLIGVATHRLLQHLARQGTGHWHEARLAALTGVARTMLRDAGLDPGRLADAAHKVVRALARCLDDPRGRWLLDPTHQDAHCEWALSGRLDGRVVQAVIDRSFVDAGQRWIIDYKTGHHGGADLEGFLDAERLRYAPQLALYARLVAALDRRPIRLALYFPRLAGWREWPWTPECPVAAS